jgi:hypothetical protein
MKSASDKGCREESKYIYSITFISENRAVYEIMWKNLLQPGRPQGTL